MALDTLIACFQVDPTLTMSARPEDRADCGPVIFSSGIVRSSSEMDAFVASPSKFMEAEYMLPLDLSDPFNPPLTCIDPATGLDPNGNAPDDCSDCNSICRSSYRVAKRMAAQCWQYDYVSQLCQQSNTSQEDFIVDHINNEFWIRWHEREMLAIMNALVVDNITNHDSDMVVDITTQADPLDTLFGNKAHLNAIASMGCGGDYSGIIMHEDVFLRNLRQNELQCCGQETYESERLVRSPLMRQAGLSTYVYQGKPVYLSNDSALVDTTDPLNPIYKTYYFGNGLFNYGTAPLSSRDVPAFSMDTDHCANAGFGQVKMWSRKQYALHPVGWTNTWNINGTSNSTGMPNTQIGNPAFWNRVFQRRNIPFAAVLSNG